MIFENALQKVRTQIFFKENHSYFGALFTSYLLMGLTILVQIVLVPLYLKNLGKFQFGLLMLLFSFVNYASVGIGWASGGMLRILTEFKAKEDIVQFNQSYGLAKIILIGYAIFIAALMFLAAYVFDGWFLQNVPPEYYRITQHTIGVAGLYIIILYDFYSSNLALIACKKQMIANLLLIISLLTYIVFVIPWLVQGGSLEGIFIFLLCCNIMSRLISIVWIKKSLKVDFLQILRGLLNINTESEREIKQVLKRLFGKMGLGFLFFGILSLTLQADILFIGLLGGTLIVAEFTLIWKIAEVLIQLISKFTEQFSPYIIHMDVKEEKMLLKKIARTGYFGLAFLSIMVGLLYAFFGNKVVSLWVGPDLAPKQDYAYWLAGAAIAFIGTSRLPLNFAFNLVHFKSLNKIIVFELLSKIIITILLFPYVGYISIFIAIIVTHLGGIAYGYWRLLPDFSHSQDANKAVCIT